MRHAVSILVTSKILWSGRMQVGPDTGTQEQEAAQRHCGCNIPSDQSVENMTLFWRMEMMFPRRPPKKHSTHMLANLPYQKTKVRLPNGRYPGVTDRMQNPGSVPKVVGKFHVFLHTCMHKGVQMEKIKLAANQPCRNVCLFNRNKQLLQAQQRHFFQMAMFCHPCVLTTFWKKMFFKLPKLERQFSCCVLDVKYKLVCLLEGLL